MTINSVNNNSFGVYNTAAPAARENVSSENSQIQSEPQESVVLGSAESEPEMPKSPMGARPASASSVKGAAANENHHISRTAKKALGNVGAVAGLAAATAAVGPVALIGGLVVAPVVGALAVAGAEKAFTKGIGPFLAHFAGKTVPDEAASKQAPKGPEVK